MMLEVRTMGFACRRGPGGVEGGPVEMLPLSTVELSPHAISRSMSRASAAAAGVVIMATAGLAAAAAATMRVVDSVTPAPGTSRAAADKSDDDALAASLAPPLLPPRERPASTMGTRMLPDDDVRDAAMKLLSDRSGGGGTVPDGARGMADRMSIAEPGRTRGGSADCVLCRRAAAICEGDCMR